MPSTIALKDAANTVLFPLVGIFIGLAFAWVGNAQSLIQPDQIRKIIRVNKLQLSDFSYRYQMAILVLFACLVVWGLAGLNIFDPKIMRAAIYAWVTFGIFVLTSVAFRECWHVVLSARTLLVAQDFIREGEKRDDEEKGVPIKQ
jgi:sterol desaturase/sphingolipid hydroxylase (fatty acid hydroxylase superfamily)